MHARRKFTDLWNANKHPVAEEAINRFAELYRIEAEAKDLRPEDRRLVREQHAKPRLDAMHTCRLLRPRGPLATLQGPRVLVRLPA